MSTAQDHHRHRRRRRHHHQQQPPSTFLTMTSSMATAPGNGIKLLNLSLPKLSWAHKNHHRSHLDPDHGKVEKDDVGLGGEGGGAREEGNEVRQWNLRPRKVATLPPPTTTTGVDKFQDAKTVPSRRNISGTGDGASGSMLMKSSKSTRRGVGALGNAGCGHGSEGLRKVVDKRKLWISLSKEEIDEDVYSMTGSRPRRPKKRPRNVQKLLDNIFPALYLVGISAESYKGHDPQPQK